ncbi:hypothetical protein O6H91_06G002200 [Diphasiastrum complanatum]|uniref:Uncharacterized protein n=1 Tax=Diphasiastrum complanatum TaxID=34168 RepID=A0ACC2DAP0_DIPCM|nr:hypothetical protein O6H91_06G002200 [Diphasiastrum complanatum]
MARSLLIEGLIVMLLPALCIAMDSLKANLRLHSNEQVQSGNGYYSLVMQGDCNLVLYRVSDSLPLWNSQTAGKGTYCFTFMQGDGNLVVYSGANLPVWSSGTARLQDDYRLVMQNDGNLVVYTSSNVAIFDTKTVQH